MKGFSINKTTLLPDFRPLLLATRLLQASRSSQAKQKIDLSPSIFIAETLNNYLAFRHNVGLPSREPDWARCPTHCLGVCILAHRQANVQVLGICEGVIQHSCSPRNCPSEEELQQPRTPVRPFRGIIFYFKSAKTVILQMFLACRGGQGVR